MGSNDCVCHQGADEARAGVHVMSDYPNNILDTKAEIILNPKQRSILEGLKSIGEEIASLYQDGIRIMQSDIAAKANIVAHCAREIDAGLRDVLVGKYKEKINHIDTICLALEIKKSTDFAKSWKNIAEQFPGIAHRHGAWRKPREENQIVDLWAQYENVLFFLVGTFLSLISRIDVIIQNEIPRQYSIDSLPNLLNNSARRLYFFTNLKSKHWLIPLRDKGFFCPSSNPKLVKLNEDSFLVPYWPDLAYLKKVSKSIDIDDDGVIINSLLSIIENIAEYRDGEARIENYKTDWMITSILSSLPVECLTKEHFKYIGWFLQTPWNDSLVASVIEESLMPKLVEKGETEKILWLLDVILEHEIPDKDSSYRLSPAMDSYWLGELLKKNVKRIAEICGDRALDLAMNKIDTIPQDRAILFSSAFINSIEDRAENVAEDSYAYLIVYFIRDLLHNMDAPMRRRAVERLVKKESDIFLRVVFHTINMHYEELHDIFWGWQGNLLAIHDAKHEIFLLLENHCRGFSQAEIKITLEWVEDWVPQFAENRKPQEEDVEKWKALGRKEWLSALHKTENEEVERLYGQYNAINPVKLDHPGHDYYTESRSGYLVNEEILQALEKSVKEIVEYIRNFKGGDDWHAPSRDGLADALRGRVIKEPEKFSREVDAFASVDGMYLYQVITGLDEAWRQEKTFDWKAILQFIKTYIQNDSFQVKNSQNQDDAHAVRLAGEFARLIETGTRDDNNAFDPALLPIAESILLLLIDLVPTELGDDVVEGIENKVLNSSKGKVIEALVHYALRCARLEDKPEGPRWSETIRTVFDERLSRQKDPSLEFSAIMGRYIANFFYLERVWSEENFNKIFPLTMETHWLAAMKGYLLRSSKIFKDIYLLMKGHGHYHRILDMSSEDEWLAKSITGHVCIGYFLGWDTLDEENSLIGVLLQKADTRQLTEMIEFVRRRGKPDDPQTLERVKQIWARLYQIIQDKQKSPEYQKLASLLSSWITLIDDLDKDVYQWLMLSAEYFGHGYESFKYVEKLAEFASKYPQWVGGLMLKIAQNDPSPEVRDEPKETIVKALYEAGHKETADAICNTYGERGAYFLRPLYDMNNKQSSG